MAKEVKQSITCKENWSCLHIDLGFKQLVKGLLACGVRYWHVEVLGQVRRHNFVQHQEQDIPATNK
jgi:hypothetical protein